MSRESHRQYVKGLIAAGKCCQCRGPQTLDRLGKQLCPACSKANTAATVARCQKLIADGICRWCREPIEPERRGMWDCRSCIRLTNAKRPRATTARLYVCGLCRTPGHSARTCELRAKAAA